MTDVIQTLQMLPEPLLQFGHGQMLPDPKDGLFLFGPMIDEGKPAEMRVGVIGTDEGIARYKNWVTQITGYIPAAKAEQHHLAFPGFEAAFKTRWPANPVAAISISAAALASTVRIPDGHERVYKTVDLFDQAIRKFLREEDSSPAVWFVVIPDDVHRFCRPKSTVPLPERTRTNQRFSARTARSFVQAPSMFAEDNAAAEPYRYEVDFHNQLKARLLDQKVVLQIVRESTLDPEGVSALGGKPRMLQDPANIAWNLSTTAFFKAGGRPWALAGVREDVCYIGLVFKKTDTSGASGNACCGAQMFLGSGDGVVFKGAVGPWYSLTTSEFHLDEAKAKEIAGLVVEAYVAKHGRPPKELFIHAKQHFSEAEWRGFSSAVGAETQLVGVRIQTTREIKLFRQGRSPVLRGTALTISPRKGYLWTVGFVPDLQTYPGREAPNPLSIELTRGDADLTQVMQDVLGLTKLNFNACIYGRHACYPEVCGRRRRNPDCRAYRQSAAPAVQTLYLATFWGTLAT
ncbi:hypothetical protein [Brevundimonas diminuta]|uniref:hypothetical protein n=1 Tax=Brevundimonas diminuta TaxID=293 RepID=UPI000316FFFB|nr:hypothetical protein [Brevundimonas diminuta]WQE44118.1 hypothetical protein U0020_11000 [Brevundimonas diminuta]SUW16615.1 Uncharacterised protein [Brevundimonas diminuta]